jgi:hypothetical protein
VSVADKFEGEELLVNFRKVHADFIVQKYF